MAYSVFISSTQQDLELARDLERRLKDAGARVYSVEKSSTPGENILSSFKKELHESDEVVVLLTANSVNSPGLISEMGAAFGLNKHVTPVLVNVEGSELPPFITRNAVRFADLPQYISGLKKRVEEAHSPAPA